MNREQLKALGLTDEQIDSVMASHGTVVNATKQALDTVTTEKDDLKTQIADRDTQLTQLGTKVKDNADLTTEIERLKNENATATSDLQKKLDEQSLDFNMEKALTLAGARNPKALRALLSMGDIKVDGDKLLGLDTQLEALKASDAYLFADAAATVPPASPTFVLPGNPNGGSNNVLTSESFNKMSYKERLQVKKDNPKTYESLTGK